MEVKATAVRDLDLESGRFRLTASRRGDFRRCSKLQDSNRLRWLHSGPFMPHGTRDRNTDENREARLKPLAKSTLTRILMEGR